MTVQNTTRRRLLLPPSGSDEFNWIGEVAIERHVSSVLLELSDEGQRLDVVMRGDEEIAQVWQKGGLCAICGGQLGPTGTEACEAPF